MKLFTSQWPVPPKVHPGGGWEGENGIGRVGDGEEGLNNKKRKKKKRKKKGKKRHTVIIELSVIIFCEF